MAKVITSQGIQEFVASGKFDTVKNDPPKKPNDAPPLDVKGKPPLEAVKTDDKKEENKQVKETKADHDEELTEKIRALMESDPELAEYVTKKNAAINRKHKEMREAREAAEEAERFAENQYNERQLSGKRITALEQQLAELSKTAPTVVKEELSKPDPKVFYDDKGQFKAFEYAEALAAYSASKAVADDRAKQAEETRKAELATAEALARERVAASTEKYPDFAEVMAASDLQTHTAVLQYLSASEYIGDVSYYLAKHPDFVARINKLNPLKAIAEIGKLEATFEKPPAKTDDKSEEQPPVKTSSAPAPIKPLSSATTVNTNTDPAKMTYRELRAYERARARRR